MKLLHYKGFKAAVASTAIIAMLFAGVRLHASSKADEQPTTGTNKYAAVKRDTSISAMSNGLLEIKRNEPKGTFTGTKDAWTLLIYMTGSDLESDYENATKDIKEMISSTYSASDVNKLKIIIQTGGSKNWHTDGIKSGQIGRYQLVGDELKLIETQPDASMGDASTLYNFLNWGVKNYDSEHMGFIFWNHGSGVGQGLCVDTVHDFDFLSLGEVEYAFAKLNNTLTHKFDLIGFDTCLSASLEYAAVLATYANYMVASADVEPGDGWHYTPFLDYLVSNPDCSGYMLGRKIAESYSKYYENIPLSEDGDDAKRSTTIAVFDLSKVDKVLLEMNYFAKFIDEKLNTDKENFTKFAALINECKTFQKLNVDIGTLINALAKKNQFDYDPSYFKNAVNEFILFKQISSEYASKGCNGLTIYLPYETLSLAELNMYRNAGFSPYWLNVLEYLVAITADSSLKDYVQNKWEDSEFFFENDFGFIAYDNSKLFTMDAYSLISSNDSYADNGFIFNWFKIFDVYQKPVFTPPNPFGGMSLEISRDGISSLLASTSNVKNVFSTVFATIDDELVCLGEIANTSFNNETGEIHSKFNGEWFSLPDGQLLTSYVIDSSENSVIYGFPVMINNVESTIRLEEVTTNNNRKIYNLLGVWDATDNSEYSPRGYLPLILGTEITPIYDVYIKENHTYETTYGEPYVLETKFDFFFTDIEDGTYEYSFTIDRTFGCDIYSKTTNFYVNNGVYTIK